MNIKHSRREFLGITTAAAISLGAAGLMSACSIPLNPSFIPRTLSTRTVSNSGGLLRYASRTPYSIEPYHLQGVAGVQIALALFEPLLRYDYRQKKLVPAAAESWRASEDGKVFTFRLARDCKFHNGEPVTADDIKYSWERLFKPAYSDNGSINMIYLSDVFGANALYAQEAESLTGVRALSTRTIEVSLERANYDFPYVVTHPCLAPVPAKEIDERGDDFFSFPIGNGPFKLVNAWQEGADSINLERFEEFHGDKALLKYVDFIFFADSDSTGDSDSAGNGANGANHSFAAFESEDVDVARIPIEQLEPTRSSFGISPDGYTAEPSKQVLSGERATVHYLELNLTSETLADLRVRRAISMALDRNAICEEVHKGLSLPALDIVPTVVEGSVAGTWAESGSELEAAKQLLLDFANGKDPSCKNLIFIDDSPAASLALIEKIKADLEAVGFSLKVVQPVSLEHAQALNKEATLRLNGWTADFPTMENFLEPLFAAHGIANMYGYANAALDETLANARAVEGDTTRMLHYQSANKMAAGDMPVVPLYYPRLDLVSSKRVHDLFVAPDEMADLAKAWVTI